MTYKPTWAAYEKDANDPNDANKALKASDMFVSERDKELKTSAKARKWEKDRKESIYKEKPTFIKKRIKEQEEKKLSSIKSIKELGSFDQSIKPMPGFLIVDVEEKETTTSAGIILATPDQSPNTGIVVEVSDDLFIYGQYVKCPVKVGDRILFKRMAGQMGSPGAEISINDKEFRLMRWSPEPINSDILGLFID